MAVKIFTSDTTTDPFCKDLYPWPSTTATSRSYEVKLESHTTKSTSKNFLKKYLTELIPISEFRVVYGGNHTVLLNKRSGRRVCQVVKDDDDINSLPRAVLYLVLKFKGLGGKQIQDWSKVFIGYSTRKWKTSFEHEFLRWLLEYGAKEHYTASEVNDILNTIYFHPNTPTSLDAFLFFLCEDRFGIAADEIHELISSAVCSEKPKDKNRVPFNDLTSGKTDSFGIDVIKLNPEDERLEKAIKRLLDSLLEANDILEVCDKVCSFRNQLGIEDE